MTLETDLQYFVAIILMFTGPACCGEGSGARVVLKQGTQERVAGKIGKQVRLVEKGVDTGEKVTEAQNEIGRHGNCEWLYKGK